MQAFVVLGPLLSWGGAEEGGGGGKMPLFSPISLRPWFNPVLIPLAYFFIAILS